MAMVDSGGPPPGVDVVEERCTNDPNFAVICDFIQEFGTFCGVECPCLGELQRMLEDTSTVRQELVSAPH